ncbi:MAG: S1C family serine protease [Lachnospiraceae bacterium]|nr:S1C family serine protease [Lachnospiraceae bacterium]
MSPNKDKMPLSQEASNEPQGNPAEGDGYQFITEKRKKKPVNKRRAIGRIFFTLFLAVLFGAVAFLVFWELNRRLMPQTRNTIIDLKEVLPALSAPVREVLPAVSSAELPETEPEELLSENTAETVPDKEISENTGGVSENIVDSVSSSPIINNNITERVSLNIQDYRGLYGELYQSASRAGLSLVTVTGTRSDTDWFENEYEASDQSSGLIVADNGRELLILSDGNSIDRAERLSVEFADGTRAEGRAGKSDPNTGLMIIGVELSDISDETMTTIRKAVFGNSSVSTLVGEPCIAIGSPLGTASVAYGFVTSNSRSVSKIDRNLRLLTTDIYGSTLASGVIVNYSGLVLGVITTKDTPADTSNLISAYAISDIRDVIEKLSNSSSQSCLGIYGTDVTEEAQKKYNVPMGAFVTEIVLDSPAMEAGIQSGDVITKLGTESVSSFEDYTAAIDNTHPGDNIVVTVERRSRDEFEEMTFDARIDEL